MAWRYLNKQTLPISLGGGMVGRILRQWYQLPESLLHAHFVIALPEPNCSRAEEIITWFSPIGRTGRVPPAYRWHPVLCTTYFAIQQKILTEKQEPQLILSGRTSIILAFLKDKLVVKLDINKPWVFATVCTIPTSNIILKCLASKKCVDLEISPCLIYMTD